MKEATNEMLLSNCSLNSSSSGASSSSNSFENKSSTNEVSSDQWGGAGGGGSASAAGSSSTNAKQFLNGSGSSLNVTLTPSESTSELSVLSINNFSSSNNITKKTNTLLNSNNNNNIHCKGLKPSVSTGAIPKSISFDMSADKGLDEDTRSKRGGFFGKLRMGFRNRRGKAFRNQDDFKIDGDDIKRPNESPIKVSNSGECFVFFFANEIVVIRLHLH